MGRSVHVGVLCMVAVAECLVAAVYCQEGEPWWRTATFYEVYPRSFKDSDGDGVGDIKGILQKADHFKELGVDAIWLGPIHPSPMVDMGYDISDFRDINPLFGTMNDYETLLAKCREMGIKVAMDFVPNHTSDQHPWFQVSSDPDHPLYKDYKDFYVWVHPYGYMPDGDPIVPNNWVCVFGNSPWKWNPKRNQFYFHNFAVQQPELNFFNPNVIENITDILDFWIEKGVDGFRVDAAGFLYEDMNLTNETLNSDEPASSVPTWWNMNHTATQNRPETFKLLEYWAEHLFQRGKEKDKHLGMFMEIFTTLEIDMKYYGTGNHSLKIPFNFLLMGIRSTFLKSGSYFANATDFKDIIEQWMSSMPNDGVATWVASNHDTMRIPNKFGPAMVDTINLLLAVLPGVQVVYYGDEIGMENTPVSWEQVVDPWPKAEGQEKFTGYSRDLFRSPMQWDDNLNAGFSTSNKTWLPVNENYWETNVACQKATATSHLKVFQEVVKARKDEVFKKGALKVLSPNDNTLIIVRSYNGTHYVLISNLGITEVKFNSSNLLQEQELDMDWTVVTSSVQIPILQGYIFHKGEFSVTLKPKASILLRSSSAVVIQSSIILILIFISCFTNYMY